MELLKHQTNCIAPHSTEMPGQAILDELYGRLVPIHCAQMAGPIGNEDVECQVRGEFGELLDEVDWALKQAGRERLFRGVANLTCRHTVHSAPVPG